MPHRPPRALAIALLLAAWPSGRPPAQTQTQPHAPAPATRRLIDSVVSLPSAPTAEILREALRPIDDDTLAMRYLRQRAATLGRCTAESFAANHLGRLRRNASDFPAALALHDEAYALALACRDTAMMAEAKNGAGTVHRRRDALTDAINAHSDALRLAERVPTPTPALSYAHGVALNALGNVYLTLELWDDAARAFERSLALQDSLDNPLGVAINLQNLGYAVLGQGQRDRALAYFESSRRENAALDNAFGLMLNDLAIADLYVTLQRPREARTYVERALPTARAGRDTYHGSYAEVVAGAVEVALGEASRAEDYLRRGIALADDGRHPQHHARALALLASVDSLRGDFRQAFAHLREAESIEDAVVNDKNRRYIGDLATLLTAERQRGEIDRLAQENALVRERARRDRLALLSVVGAVLLLGGILLVLYRQRAIIETRDLAQLEQQRLASQMNPHFLFNALNSVKAFLIDHDRTAAIRYLDAFAKLVRRILTSSIDETVPLGEELDNCRLYVTIENARLGNSVDFHLAVEDGLDLNRVKVPPLVLQPFLENAFWHGLHPKRGPRTLSVEVARAPDCPPDPCERVRITVRDNGIGRVAAAELRARRARPRASVGIDITRRRLEVYAKRTGRRARFETRDLVGSGGEALGTEVVVELG